MTAYLGIDTSCYTTSVAIADNSQQILCNIKIPLEVEQGKKGLQQSQAVFLHIRNFTKMFEENQLTAYAPFNGICVSEKPRPCNDSYMPVFTVGTMVGQAVASITGAPLFCATHQEGHLWAALIGKTMPKRFIAAHVSGGTTEILDVTRENDSTFSIKILGGTLDIAAGQLIDRFAQKIELPFPGGRHIETLAENGADLAFKHSVCGCDINFSGIEAQALRAVGGEDHADICYSILLSIAVSLEHAVKNATQKTGLQDVLLFGGVMSNKLIRTYLSKKLDRIQFAEIEYSSDNAAGLAVLAAQKGATK
ncbi:MAG: hypothetical protein RR389_04430 [Christensenella sp.]